MGNKIKILLVDDRKENLVTLKAILEAPGLEILTATSGNESCGLWHGDVEVSDYYGVWNHYAFVKNSTAGEMKMYQNGLVCREVAESKDANLPMYGGAKLALGRRTTIAGNDSWQGLHQGRIDDFRIYSYALSQAEVLATAGMQSLPVPLTDAQAKANLFNAGVENLGTINLKDYAELADAWLVYREWPEWGN